MPPVVHHRRGGPVGRALGGEGEEEGARRGVHPREVLHPRPRPRAGKFVEGEWGVGNSEKVLQLCSTHFYAKYKKIVLEIVIGSWECKNALGQRNWKLQ